MSTLTARGKHLKPVAPLTVAIDRLTRAEDEFGLWEYTLAVREA
jgi:hypothetical protein